jgi:HK97 gp10 family phage protein
MPRGMGRSGGDTGIEIIGLAQLMRDLKKFEPAVNKEFRTRVRKAVKVVAEDAKRRAPKASGKLARGIKPSVTNTGAVLRSTAKHARIHEFGGRHPVFGRDTWVFQPARPHIFPAVTQGRAAVDKEALAALDDAAQQIGFS